MTAAKSTSIMILGGPDAGKSNYIGALWMCLRRNKGSFRIPYEPANIAYVEGIVGHLREGRFPPRTEPNEGDATFVAPISLAHDPHTPIATVTVPDMIGEVWKAASKDREIDPIWIEQLRNSEAAMLFVRFASEENVEMPDWVTSAKLMRLESTQELNVNDDGGDSGSSGSTDTGNKDATPTQMFLSDLLNLLDEHLGRNTALERPRVALMITAWDGVGTPERAAGPKNFIKNDYPMLHGRIADRSRFQLRVFGVSATGYNLEIEDERARYLQVGPAEAGFAETEINGGISKGDVLMPLAWALQRENE